MSTAILCDRCGERIYGYNPAHPGRGHVRIYIDPPAGKPSWHEFHTDCAKDMTITDILNGGRA